jgi:hypothetical protein
MKKAVYDTTFDKTETITICRNIMLMFIFVWFDGAQTRRQNRKDEFG